MRTWMLEMRPNNIDNKSKVLFEMHINDPLWWFRSHVVYYLNRSLKMKSDIQK